MADRIERNENSEFGGAMLIISPAGEVTDVLLVGSKPDNVHFWATIKNKMEDAAAQAILAEEKKQPFGMQRR